MGKQRSPNYPSVDLETALVSVKAIYDKEGRTTVPPEVAVKAWSYNSLSGPARRRLAALKTYGLVELGKNGVKVSPRAMTLLLMPKGSSDYGKALKEAAQEPEIFRELYHTQRDASDDALKHHLVVDRDFTDEGAKRFIEVFRASVRFARLDEARPKEVVEPRTEAEEAVSFAQEGQHQPPVHRFRWPLSRSVVAEVSLIGDKITAKDLEMLRQYLELAKAALEESARPNGGS